MIEKTFIEKSMKKIALENYVKDKLDRAGFTHLEIIKTPLVTRIVLNVTKPGLAIGKGGQTIRQLTLDIEKKFKIDNPQIEIQEIRVPDLDAQATVDKVATLIERGFSWRSVAFRTVRDIVAAGAQGVELTLSGKLSGKGGRKRKQRIFEGYMKKVGAQTDLVDYAKKTAYPKAGAIGVKLRIIHPDTKFPDKADFEGLIKERIEAKQVLIDEISKKDAKHEEIKSIAVKEEKLSVEETQKGKNASKKIEQLISKEIKVKENIVVEKEKSVSKDNEKEVKQKNNVKDETKVKQESNSVKKESAKKEVKVVKDKEVKENNVDKKVEVKKE